MPLRLLWTTGERLQLRKEGGADTEVHGQLKTNRGAGRKQELLDLSPDPFGREIVELNRLAERTRVGVELEIEARHELDCAQHPEAVIRKGPGVDHPQAAPLEIIPAAKRIEVLVS